MTFIYLTVGRDIGVSSRINCQSLEMRKKDDLPVTVHHWQAMLETI